MVNIAPVLYGQSDKYIRVWLYILTHIEGNNVFTVSDIMLHVNISRVRLYDILNRGVDIFSKHGYTVTFDRSYKTDKYITINIDYAKSPKKKTVKSTIQVVEDSDDCVDIIDYLNKKAETGYRHDNKNTIRLITSLLRAGYKKEQLFYVIDIKTKQWMGTEQQKYLRPETLFGNRFEGYVNEKPNNNNTTAAKRVASAQSTLDLDWEVRGESK